MVLRAAGAVATTAALLSATGCGGGNGGESAPAHTAQGFADAVSTDARAACRDLAPATRSELVKSAGQTCPKALSQEQLPEPGALRETKIFGSMAIARFAADTMFLSRFGSGWKVVAAGCRPQAEDQPFDCVLKGA